MRLVVVVTVRTSNRPRFFSDVRAVCCCASACRTAKGGKASWGHEGLLHISQKLRLVRFDRHDVVRLLVDESLAELPLAVQSVCNDEFAVQNEIANQGRGLLYFVGL